MSVPYENELLVTDTLRLLINAGGITREDTTDKENFSLSLFAFNKAKGLQIFSEKLNFSQAKSLYDYLNSFSILKEGGPIKTGRFIEITDDSSSVLAAINKVDSSLVQQLLKKADDSERLNLIIEALSTIELQNLHASIRQATHKQALENLNKLLDLEKEGNITTAIKSHTSLERYAAGQSEKIFQNWIEQNIWVLGIDYIARHSARQISIESISDLMMESTDGYIDLIELKRPSANLLAFDPSHKSYYPSVDLSKVIGQCFLYLKTLDDYKLLLEKKHKYKLLRPRIKIIGGRSNDFNDDQHDALRMINSGLNSVQVMSYDYLYSCGQNIISYYDNQIKESIETEGEQILTSMS